MLGPGCVSSGEGFAKMMKCLPRVTTSAYRRVDPVETRSHSSSRRPGYGDLLALGGHASRRHAGRRPRHCSRDLVDLPEASYQTADPTWERALEVLREKVKATPKPEIRHGDPSLDGCRPFRTGSCSVARGRHDAAETSFRQALAVDPMLATAWVGVSQVQAERGEIERSCESARSALAVNPRLAEAHWRLAITLRGRLLDTEVEAIERLIDDPSMSAGARASSCTSAWEPSLMTGGFRLRRLHTLKKRMPCNPAS